MALRLNTSAEPVWVTDEQLAAIEPSIVAPDPDAAYLLRPLGKSDAQRIRQPFVTMRFDPRSHQKVEADLTPEQSEALSAEIIDHILVDWRGYVQDDGAPLPCSREHKLLLAERDSLRHGKIFTSTNSASGNELLVYAQGENGAATYLTRAATNGLGTGAGLGSQGAVALSRNGGYLFVVNAASNTVWRSFHWPASRRQRWGERNWSHSRR